MSNALTVKFAEKFSVDQSQVLSTLKATCFKGPATDAQMTALLIVADQYGLNPFTKEIYAFPDKNNGIVPVVGVDGWSRIINTHPQFDGMDFNEGGAGAMPDWIECVIHRKDRAHPIKLKEYMAECKRPVGPWQSHPRRMLRHKAMIQCARLAFGYVGIYDQDEAERIAEHDINARPARPNAAAIAEQAQTVEFTEAHESLLIDLEAVADTGAEALQSSWGAITKEQRQALAGHLESLKKRAKQADSQGVDHAE